MLLLSSAVVFLFVFSELTFSKNASGTLSNIKKPNGLDQD